MTLLPKEIAGSIPALYAQEEKGEEAVVHVKFFLPGTGWTWYVTEFDSENGIFFGLVRGLETEYGNFTLHELESARGPFGLRIERDLYWKPKTLAAVKRMLAEGMTA
jgi:hypothetical protein